MQKVGRLGGEARVAGREAGNSAEICPIRADVRSDTGRRVIRYGKTGDPIWRLRKSRGDFDEESRKNEHGGARGMQNL